MDKLLELLWIDAIQKGTYLVCTTSSAAKNINEHIQKQGAVAGTGESELVQQIFHNYYITLGQPYLAYQKVRKLLTAFIHQSESEAVALKNFSYSLRNMLMYSNYKDAIKAIEKPSLQLTTSDLFIRYVLDRLDDGATAYELDHYRLLYSFITSTTQANRIVSRKMGDEQSVLLIDAIKESNETAHLIKERTYGEESTLSKSPLLTKKELIELVLKDEKLTSWLRQEGLFVQDFLEDVAFTTHQLNRLSTPETDPSRVALVIAMNMVKELSNQLLQRGSEPIVKQVMPKKQDKKAVQIKAEKSDQQWQKDLHAANKEIELLRKQMLEQTAQLQQYENDLSTAKSEIIALQQEKKDLHAELELFSEQPTVSATAQRLVSNMQTMLNQLQQELKAEEEEAPKRVESYFEKINQLQVAIIGGHQKYHAQLKQDMKSDILTIRPDELNFDPRKLLKCDVVVFLSGYTNHSLYNKAFDFLKKNNAKRNCLMLQSQPNAKQLAKKVYEFWAGEA